MQCEDLFFCKSYLPENWKFGKNCPNPHIVIVSYLDCLGWPSHLLARGMRAVIPGHVLAFGGHNHDSLISLFRIVAKLRKNKNGRLKIPKVFA